MKKYLAIVFAALAVVSCNFINSDPDTPVNYDPLYCITAYQTGANISKSVFLDYSDAKESQEEYLYENNAWVFNYKIVTERTFDANGNVTYKKQSYYDEKGNLKTYEEFKYENIYNGYYLSECYVQAKQKDGEWAPTQHLYVVFMSDSNLVSQIIYCNYDEEDGEYDVNLMKSYSYYNNYTTDCETSLYDAASDKWTVISDTTYSYDDKDRLAALITSDKRAPSESTITTYYYE